MSTTGPVLLPKEIAKGCSVASMKLSNQGKRVMPSCQHPANSSAAQITGMAITSHTTHPSSFFNHLPPFHFIGKGRPKKGGP